MWKKFISGIGCCLLCAVSSSQAIDQKIQKAFTQFESDPQLKYAISSLYIIDAKTGGVVFEKNARTGLAPASTQKIITAATAFELLGSSYRYKTHFYLVEDSGKNRLVINPSGDPSFGSWRWEQTREGKTIERIVNAVKKTNRVISGPLLVDDPGWSSESIPDGWVWQDIGNYYGAGAGSLNWRENQFDLILQSGSKTGDPVKIVNTAPGTYNYKLSSFVVSAPKGSGDNAFAYFPVGRAGGVVRGTIPVDEKGFVISVAMPSGADIFQQILCDSLTGSYNKPFYLSAPGTVYKASGTRKLIYTQQSPALDSIIYWFLKKSINLYGEALLKTIAFEKRGVGATDTGVAVVKDFWKQKGIDPGELNIYDGSGLSPLNRITTHAQVEILKYAGKQTWFSSFYEALPDYNGMKLKSGTIGDVKGFCGYHRSKEGREYILSFLVNNYNGPSATLVNKMYRVLDILK